MSSTTTLYDTPASSTTTLYDDCLYDDALYDDRLYDRVWCWLERQTAQVMPMRESVADRGGVAVCLHFRTSARLAGRRECPIGVLLSRFRGTSARLSRAHARDHASILNCRGGVSFADRSRVSTADRTRLLTLRDIARLRGDHAKVADLTRQIAALAPTDTSTPTTTPTPTTPTEE